MSYVRPIAAAARASNNQGLKMAHTPFKVMAVVAASATALVGCGAAEEVTGGSSGDAEFSFTDITGRDVELDNAPDLSLIHI